MQLTNKQRTFSPAQVDQDKPTKKARTTAKPKKAVKNVGTCSMDKKEIGDRVKAALALNKYALNRTVITAGHHLLSISPKLRPDSSKWIQPSSAPSSSITTSSANHYLSHPQSSTTLPPWSSWISAITKQASCSEFPRLREEIGLPRRTWRPCVLCSIRAEVRPRSGCLYSAWTIST